MTAIETPGAGVEVTFYLLSGTVIGSLEPCWYFDQKLLHYLQTIGIDHNHPTPDEGTCGKHQFVQLSKVTYQRSGGEVNQHDQLRVRLADVHSWAFGRGHDNVKDVRWGQGAPALGFGANEASGSCGVTFLRSKHSRAGCRPDWPWRPG